MDLNQAISRIKTIEPAIRALGAVSLNLFGSTARDEATPTSDVDIFDRNPEAPCGIIELLDLEELLEGTLGTKVDLATWTSLHPALKDKTERTSIHVL